MWTTCYVHMSNKKNCGGELQGGGHMTPPLGSSRHKKRLVVGRLSVNHHRKAAIISAAVEP